ncbi:hypothetical protein E5288_WYG021618 [Bos mutus]|uniref:Uncharacterized protein n=1 Tax=Bos mutus TaxID=72004 RepID=A0A6B0RWS2_9CETA|nr:hypothetical protein [Bos mutus]
MRNDVGLCSVTEGWTRLWSETGRTTWLQRCWALNSSSDPNIWVPSGTKQRPNPSPGQDGCAFHVGSGSTWQLDGKGFRYDPGDAVEHGPWHTQEKPPLLALGHGSDTKPVSRAKPTLVSILRRPGKPSPGLVWDVLSGKCETQARIRQNIPAKLVLKNTSAFPPALA